MKHNDQCIIRKLYILRKRTLLRVMALVEKDEKLESLLRVLQFASGELQKFSELDKSKEDSTVDFIAMITNQLIESGEIKSKTQLHNFEE